jgi:hypothetical protein
MEWKNERSLKRGDELRLFHRPVQSDVTLADDMKYVGSGEEEKKYVCGHADKVNQR